MSDMGIQFAHFEGGIMMSQSKYIRQLLHHFQVKNCKPISTPLDPGFRFCSEDGSDSFDATLYQQAVGCLIYLCHTRPNLQYAVSQLCRFMNKPRTQHWQAVKRVFQYLKGTQHLGLLYDDKSSLVMHAFTNNDWAGCHNTPVSHSGNRFMHFLVQQEAGYNCHI